MFSVDGGRSRSTAAVSALSAACSMLVVRPQRRLGRRFVDECAARQSCHVSKRAMHIVLVHRRLVSAGPRCTVACVRDAICGTASTTCIGFSVRLEASATLGVPESHIFTGIYSVTDSCSAEWLCFSCAGHKLTYLLTLLTYLQLCCATGHQLRKVKDPIMQVCKKSGK